MRAVLVAVAAFLAWWLVRALARHLGGHADPSAPKRAGALFTDALLVGLLAAIASNLVSPLRWRRACRRGRARNAASRSRSRSRRLRPH